MQAYIAFEIHAQVYAFMLHDSTLFFVLFLLFFSGLASLGWFFHYLSGIIIYNYFLWSGGMDHHYYFLSIINLPKKFENPNTED